MISNYIGTTVQQVPIEEYPFFADLCPEYKRTPNELLLVYFYSPGSARVIKLKCSNRDYHEGQHVETFALEAFQVVDSKYCNKFIKEKFSLKTLD